MGVRLVGVNEKGLRVGQDHQRAKLTDRDVELIIELRGQGLAYDQIAGKFDIHPTMVRKICCGERRAQRPVRWKGVPA